MRKLEPQEIQEGRVFYNNRESVRVSRVVIRKSRDWPAREVVFQEIGSGSHAREKTLPMGLFLKQYQRRKR